MTHATTETRTDPVGVLAVQNVLASQWEEITVLRDAGWVDVTLHRIADLAYLKDNWDSYGSPPPSGSAMHAAVSMLAKIGDIDRFLPAPHVMPVSGGGVAVEWSGGERELEVEFLPDGEAEFLTVVHGEPLNEGALDSAEALSERLRWLMDA